MIPACRSRNESINGQALACRPTGRIGYRSLDAVGSLRDKPLPARAL
jgi:hypothetical protein